MNEINLPDDPKAGDTYEFAGIRYTWVNIVQINQPDRGYWRASVIESRPFMPEDLVSLRRMGGSIDIDPLDYHYKIFKGDAAGTIKVHSQNLIMSPLGVVFRGNEITEPGEYYIYGEDSKFYDSDANWVFENDSLRDDVVNLTDFVKDSPNFTGEGEIKNWNTGNIVDMNSTFAGATSFNADIGEWDVSEVTDMDNMFTGATNFDQDLSYWCVRKIVSRPVQFDIGSGFENDFDRQPDWGKCPRNEDGLNFIGNVTVEGPDAVVIGTTETYTYTNDGNYQATDRYAVLTQNWSIDGTSINDTGVDLPFDPPGRPVDVHVRLRSPYASDSPADGYKSVYIDGTIDSLDINGPSAVETWIPYTYFLDNIVGTGKDNVIYEWYLKDTNGNQVNKMIYNDTSPNSDGSIIEAYFTEAGVYDLCVTTNTDQGFEECKTVTVTELDLSLYGIVGPDSVTFGSTETYSLELPDGLIVYDNNVSVVPSDLVDIVSHVDREADILFKAGSSSTYNANISWRIITPTGSLVFEKTVTVSCIRRTVTLNASQITPSGSPYIVVGSKGGLFDPWDETNNFKEDDWYDECCDLILNIDKNVYGDLYPEDRGVGLYAGYAYDGIKVVGSPAGSLTINVQSGRVVTGGPGAPQCWSLTFQYGDKFSDFPTSGPCDGIFTGVDIPAADGESGITASGSRITINNYGTIRGGGGGGTMGGAGQFAATTDCSSTGKCTRGGFGGNGGWGAGAISFTHNKQWWSNSSSVKNGRSGIGPGGSSGRSGDGGNGGNGGGLAAGGSQGLIGKSKGSQQTGWTGCTTGPYENPYKHRTGKAGKALDISSNVVFNNFGSLVGSTRILENDVAEHLDPVSQYLEKEFFAGRMTRRDCAIFLAEQYPKLYHFLRNQLLVDMNILETEVDLVADNSLARINN